MTPIAVAGGSGFRRFLPAVAFLLAFTLLDSRPGTNQYGPSPENVTT